MKAKISRTMLIPFLSGLMSTWIVMGCALTFLISKISPADILMSFFAISGLLFLFLIPLLYRSAWAYSNARKYHFAEFEYAVGNGVDITKALGGFEKKCTKALSAWLHRTFMRNNIHIFPLIFFVLLLLGISVKSALIIVALMIGVTILTAWMAVIIMLLVARKIAYDKYGNIKNN